MRNSEGRRSGGSADGRLAGVQSVERAFGLLELLASNGGEMALTRLAEASGLPLPTIHRLLRTLASQGYVRQQPNRRYALGPRLIWLGESAAGLLSSLALPHLKQLVAALDETVNLAMLDDDRAVYVAQVPSTRAMRMFTEVGMRVHLHSTGVGKALLAQLPPDEMAALARRLPLPPSTDRTIVDHGRLLAEVQQAKSLGYAVDEGEHEVGVRCVAVPVPGGPTRTAISVSGPSLRLTDEVRDRAVVLLRDAADALAEDLLAPR